MQWLKAVRRTVPGSRFNDSDLILISVGVVLFFKTNSLLCASQTLRGCIIFADGAPFFAHIQQGEQPIWSQLGLSCK